MKDLDTLEEVAKLTKIGGNPMFVMPTDMLEIIEEVRALRKVEAQAKSSIGRLMLNAWANSLASYFDELATALSELDHIRSKR